MIQVETYEEHEQEEITHPELHEEQVRLAKELGLNGQEELVAKSDTGERIIPYRLMKKDEEKVYNILLKGKVKVEDYKAGPIPLRVLQVLSHAKSLNFFDGFHVWYAEEAEVKDPLLVGYTGESYSPTNYLLARWGDELHSLENLSIQAGNVLKTRLKSSYASKMSELESKTKSLMSLQGSEVLSFDEDPVEAARVW